jgi:hypothetical protein
MEKRWLNERDEQNNLIPDVEGNFTLVIENSAGNRVSTFKGKSMEQVLDACADAQVEANRKLGRLLKPDAPTKQPIKVEQQKIDPSDRLRLVHDLNDPNKVVEAVEEIMTKRQGASPDTVASMFQGMSDNEQRAYYKGEADAFMEDTPGYYPVEQNQVQLTALLEQRKWPLTRNNLSLVFEELQSEGKMIPWPGDAPPPPSEAAPPAAAPPPPRRYSSGLRSSDASAMKPPPPKPKPMVTRDEINKMPRHVYNERMRDPAFRKAVDALV